MTTQPTVDRLNDLRNEFHAPDATPERQEELRPLIARAKDAAIAAHRLYESAWLAAHAATPREIRQVHPTLLSVSTEAMGGGRSQYIGSSDAGWSAALVEMEARQAQDAAVAEVAFAAWGWRGAVRIDYYGPTTAMVTDGTRRLRVELS